MDTFGFEKNYHIAFDFYCKQSFLRIPSEKKNVDWKPAFGQSFLSCPKKPSVALSASLVIYRKRSKRKIFETSWQLLVHFRVLKSPKILNIGLKNEQQSPKW